VSEQTVAVARDALEAFNRGGLERVEEILGHIHEDVVWMTAETSVEADAFHGHDGVRSWFAMVADAFSEFRVVPEEFHDLGDTAVAFVRIVGTGRGSGFPFEREIAQVFTVRDGKIVRYRWFEDRERALDWAGSEE
jgi:uncharacterized protein